MKSSKRVEHVAFSNCLYVIADRAITGVKLRFNYPPRYNSLKRCMVWKPSRTGMCKSRNIMSNFDLLPPEMFSLEVMISRASCPLSAYLIIALSVFSRVKSISCKMNRLYGESSTIRMDFVIGGNTGRLNSKNYSLY